VKGNDDDDDDDDALSPSETVPFESSCLVLSCPKRNFNVLLSDAGEPVLWTN
jgi:hypothetical protein